VRKVVVALSAAAAANPIATRRPVSATRTSRSDAPRARRGASGHAPLPHYHPALVSDLVVSTFFVCLLAAPRPSRRALAGMHAT
jgi:hypothetical protein